MARAPGMARLRVGVGVGVLSLSAALASACGQVLGLDAIDYDPGDGGTGSPDSTAPPDAPSAAPDGDASPLADGPATLAQSPSGTGAVQGVAVDDTRVYWVTGGQNGSVLSVLKDGGGLTTIAALQPSPMDIAVLGSSVYWSVVPGGTGPQCMAMVASTSGDAGPSCVTSSPDDTVRMTLGGGGIVLLAQGTGPNVTNEYIGFATQGSAYTNVETNGMALAVAASENEAFLGNRSDYHVDDLALPGLTYGPILCMNDCGTAQSVDMTLDVSGANLLWITANGGVYRAPVVLPSGGATGQVLVQLPGALQRLARDASYAYVTGLGTSVFAVPLAAGDAGTFLTLASGENQPSGVAVDESAVYWGTASGAIRMTRVP